MQRPGHEPTRRNRNQGTKKRGRGQINRMVVPERFTRRLELVSFYEDLGPHVTSRLEAGSGRLRLVVEKARGGCVHACTVDDVERVLRLLPVGALEGLSAIVLRVPTRKQAILVPCWGRLVMGATIDGVEGPTVFLEAFNARHKELWSRGGPRPEDRLELERLREAGHVVEQVRSRWYVRRTLDGQRATQLLHTLPHEIGHWVDYRAHLERDAEEQYWQRPALEREQFAHRYADTLRAQWKKLGLVPFHRRQSRRRLEELGLTPADFGLDEAD